ncbi:MAG TPA: hypothetical protein VJS13_06920, partial [Pyrinomonadaceae bacterium]|nr:hypothetical protein [Pyrinomonadaceae bacterium]
SLSAADLHVVVMGDEFVGIVHPCKIYNIMAVGAPALYIGPQPSHISDLTVEITHKRHGDVDGVVETIVQTSGQPTRTTYQTRIFRKERILPQLVNAIGGNSFENLFRPLPDSDNRFVDYHAAHSAAVSTAQATRHPN